ncbi:hypothetical protein bpmyx0001_52140 [Bacillus pseudomycoides DSM 12442]|nr:hypothetical protein bpmyx0001_52140 [Bacillus pseudomycoides DSM 12442]
MAVSVFKCEKNIQYKHDPNHFLMGTTSYQIVSFYTVG